MLEAIQLHKTYRQADGELHALRGIDLKIQEGDALAIIGPSGAGKSTLLHILGGLDQPTSGQVLLEGQDMYALKDRERCEIRNSQMGFIFQFYHLLPELTTLENVILPALIKENVENDGALRIKGLNLLDQVGLSGRAGHTPNQLSGGEQQRTAIARAMVNEPRIIFCDEPTGNLDSESGEQIVRLLMDLNTRNKQTLVIVTHDENIARVARTIIRMRDGKIM